LKSPLLYQQGASDHRGTGFYHRQKAPTPLYLANKNTPHNV